MREVLIADAHPLFRDALARAVTQALPDAHLYDADSVAALLNLIEAHPHAELLLLDLHMPGANGFSALVHLRGQQPGLPVIIVRSVTARRAIFRNRRRPTTSSRRSVAFWMATSGCRRTSAVCRRKWNPPKRPRPRTWR